MAEVAQNGMIAHTARLQAELSRFAEMNAKLGGLFTQPQAALLAKVPTARIYEAVKDGRLDLYEFVVDLGGEPEIVGRYISGQQIQRFCEREKRPPGRPPSKLRMAVAGLKAK